ncbi:MAG: uracil-DNA glycosylase [Candidatus Omnitrophica bacterium]|nr:uracil-DNA glycosylase [Candidatus Omnitrophota bacterium]
MAKMHPKARQLELVRQRMLSVADLPLKKTANQLVFGDGNLDTRIFLIGEAPGRQEDEQGLPFVGSAGRKLEGLLSVIGLKREQVYITSILKYRPPNNRPPKLDEIKAHTPFLIEQIKIIKPFILVTLGNFSTKFVLAGGNTEKMSSIGEMAQLHGTKHTISFGKVFCEVMPCYHPAAMLYRPSLKQVMEDDFKKILIGGV